MLLNKHTQRIYRLYSEKEEFFKKIAWVRIYVLPSLRMCRAVPPLPTRSRIVHKDNLATRALILLQCITKYTGFHAAGVFCFLLMLALLPSVTAKPIAHVVCTYCYELAQVGGCACAPA